MPRPASISAWTQYRKLIKLDAILLSFESILFDLGAENFAKEIGTMRDRNTKNLTKIQEQAYAQCNQSKSFQKEGKG